jgi:hypothetical protein
MARTSDRLFEAVMLDLWPDGPATITDFGLVDQAHYEALHGPIRAGEITREKLAAVSCNGPAITELVNKCRSNRHKGIVFRTIYDMEDSDDLREEEEDFELPLHDPRHDPDYYTD